MKVKLLMTAFILGLFTITNIQAQHNEMHKSDKKEVKETVYTCPMHPEVKSTTKGECSKCGMKLTEKKMEMKGDKMKMKGKKMEMKHGDMAKTYTCSMHPDVTSMKPGDCPKCGMKLTEKKMEMKKSDGHNHKH